MLDMSKETHIGFLRAANKHLQEKVLLLEKQVAEHKRLAILDAELCKILSEDLLLLRKKFFGKSSEKSSPKAGKQRKHKSANLIHNQSPISALPQPYSELHSEEVVHTMGNQDSTGALASTEQKCACHEGFLKEMTNSFEESCEVHVTERQYILRRHKRQKYKCDHCTKIITAPGPAKLIPGGSFSIHMAAQVADDKFHRHIPLNRQQEMMAERGLKVDTKTLYSLLCHLMAPLEPLLKRIQQEIKSHTHLHVDETSMPLLLSQQNGYVWGINNIYGVYYQYEPTRSGKVAQEILVNYRGIVMSDGYAGYEFLTATEGVVHVMCFSHARRKFVDAIKDYPESQAVVDLFDDVYDIEHKALNLEDTAELRVKNSTEKVEAIDKWITEQTGKYLNSSLLGKAIYYWTSHHKKLTYFLSDPLVPIDNNAGEREMRRPVMGRKNFQGFRTINGADVGMFYYTIVGTCRLLGINPKAYLLETGLLAAKGQNLATPLEYARALEEKVKGGAAFADFYQVLRQ